MIIKYDNTSLMNKVLPEISVAKKKIPVANNYYVKSKCPKDYKYIGLLNQVLNELQSNVQKLTTLENNIRAKNQRIATIDKNVRELLYYNTIDTLKVQKPKI